MKRLVKNALKNGIYIKDFNNNLIDFFKRPRLYYSDDFKCWCFELGLGAYVVRLKDYKVYWTLKEKDFKY